MNKLLSRTRLKHVILFGAGLGYLAVALVSWLPAAYRPHIVVVSDKFEHALAYLLLGALTAIAARQTLNAYRLALAIVAYAGLLELGQLLIPSRVSSVEDFVASAAGAIMGVLITTLALRRLARQ
jgi:VanZ family protein